jgi:hypothetical protein
LDSRTCFSAIPFSPGPGLTTKSVVRSINGPVPRTIFYPTFGTLLGKALLLPLISTSPRDSYTLVGKGPPVQA